MLWSSWNIGVSQSGFKLELLFIRFLPLWFGKKLEYSLSRVFSISDKQGLKRKFQVGVLGSHPVLTVRLCYSSRDIAVTCTIGVRSPTSKIHNLSIFGNHWVRRIAGCTTAFVSQKKNFIYYFFERSTEILSCHCVRLGCAFNIVRMPVVNTYNGIWRYLKCAPCQKFCRKWSRNGRGCDVVSGRQSVRINGGVSSISQRFSIKISMGCTFRHPWLSVYIFIVVIQAILHEETHNRAKIELNSSSKIGLFKNWFFRKIISGERISSLRRVQMYLNCVFLAVGCGDLECRSLGGSVYIIYFQTQNRNRYPPPAPVSSRKIMM